MQSVALIAPDFFLIVLGAVLSHKLGYPRSFWNWAERLVFYVLLPPMLFLSVANSKLALGASGEFVAVSLLTMGLGTLLCWLVRYVVKTDDVTFASLFHTGFRFNAYIGFALCLRMFGQEGFAYFALIIAFWIPISNALAVIVLANAVEPRRMRESVRDKIDGRSGRATIVKLTGRAIVRNPLIIATLLGLVFNVLGLGLSDIVTAMLRNLGSASLALGLLCIGAGLEFAGIRSSMAALAAVSVVRLFGIGAVALGVTNFFDRPALSASELLLFTVLPTGQSCYVMTANMGGNAPAVACITTLQTLASMVTLPLWIAFCLS